MKIYQKKKKIKKEKKKDIFNPILNSVFFYY